MLHHVSRRPLIPLLGRSLFHASVRRETRIILEARKKLPISALIFNTYDLLQWDDLGVRLRLKRSFIKDVPHVALQAGIVHPESAAILLDRVAGYARHVDEL